MSASARTIIRYLLGELSESAKAALEDQYFADPHAFDKMVKTENELADAYVRGRLPRRMRERFERSYLADPRRRERVQFAEALVAKLDRIQGSRAAAEQSVGLLARWQRPLAALRGQRRLVGLSMAVAFVLIAVGGVRSFIESRRVRQELAQTQARRADLDRRDREIAAERAAALTAERARVQRPREQTPRLAPTPPERVAAPTVVTLVLAVSDVRGVDAGPPITLVVPTGTEQVRLQLSLKDHEYKGYSVVLRAVGGAEVFQRQGLQPRTTKSGAVFVLTVPASELTTGDYVLTLKGLGPNDEVDELSESIFHVKKT